MSDDLSDLSDDDLKSMYSSMSDEQLTSAYSNMSDEELTSAYSSMSDEELKAAWGKPEAEGVVATGAREAAHAALPAATGFVGMGAGAKLGGAYGLAAGPWGGLAGAVGGGLVGMVAGSMLGSVAQEAGLQAAGFDDREQRLANREENPNAAFVGTMLPATAAMSPVGIGGGLARQAGIRGAGAGLSAGFEAGQEYLVEGKVNPNHVGMAAVQGAAFPGLNRVGQRLHDIGAKVPTKFGRPVAPPDLTKGDLPEADAADVLGNEMAGPQRPDPAAPPAATVAGVGSARTYEKGAAPSAEAPQITAGDMDPATIAAIKNPDSPPVADDAPDPLERHDNSGFPPGQLPGRHSSDIQWQDLPANDPRGDSPQAPIPPHASALGTHEGAVMDESMRLSLDDNALPGGKRVGKKGRRMEPVVDTGMPQPGEPVAMGANDAAPMPADMPTKAAAAIEQVTPPEFKGDTNPAPTEGQAGAGNYAKAKAYDFGKPIKKETDAGGMRKGKNPDGTAWEHKSPYEYGYFNKTKGADKDHIDWARPHKDDAEHLGNKHFIIDQAHADGPKAGMFDEHKIFTYYKDEAAARDHYLQGFGDGKGEQRLGKITEVSAGDVSKFLTKHTLRSATKPYDPVGFGLEKGSRELKAAMARPKAPVTAAVKPAVEPKVVTRARELMAEKGLPEDAIKIFNELSPDQRAVEAAKYVNAVGSKTGEVKSAKNIRIRPKAATVPGTEGITARSKADAEKKGAALTRMNKAMNDNPPVAGEDQAALRARLEKLVADAGDALEVYKPSVKPAAYQLVRQARQMLKLKKGWTDEKLAEFNANEMKLRSGNAADIADVRATNRIEADIARSRRSGDDAIASAESDLAVAKDVEDALIEHLDLEKSERAQLIKGPHHEAAAKAEAEAKQIADDAMSGTKGSLEERIAQARDDLDDLLAGRRASPAERAAAERAFEQRAREAFTAKPVKTKADLPKRKAVDSADSVLNTKGKPTAEEAAAARAKELEAARERGRARIDIGDPKEVERLAAMMEKAAERGKLASSEAKAKKAPSLKDEDPDALHESAVQKLLGKAIDFGRDQSGAGHPGIVWRDLKKAVGGSTSLTPIKSYIAKTSKVPHSEYVRSLSDDLHKSQQAEKAHKIELGQMLVQAEKDFNPVPQGLVNKAKHIYNHKTRMKQFAAMAEKVYLAHEQGKLNILNAEETRLYDKHLKPLISEMKTFVDAIRMIDEKAIGPDVANHMYRISKNEAHDFGLPQDGSDPTQPAYHNMSTFAKTALERTFVAIERVSDGKRFVISPDKNGFTLWQKYRAQPLKHPDFAFVADQPLKIGKEDFIMRDAFTPEIEANARASNGQPMKYYKNAFLSVALAHAQLGSKLRHMIQLGKIAQDPRFEKLATTDKDHPMVNDKKNPWQRPPRGTMFDHYYMDPHLLAVFEDYAKSGFDTPNALRALSQNITKLLFWSPIAHMANVGVHWVVGRGWDWVTPKGTYSLVVDGLRAIKSVVAQDDLYRQMMRDGAGLVYGGVVAEGFVDKSLKRVGEDIIRNPSKWGPIADTLGVGLKKLYDTIYDASKHSMWSVNDMFLVQRILELERKGHSRKAAIAEAEQDIPNYRVPTHIVTEGKLGRFMQKLATTPELLVFGRYHYGVFNSFANILKKTFGASSTLADRWDGLGKLFIMGVLATAVYPLWDKAIKLFTGNEDARAHRRGPNAVISHVSDSVEGKADVMKAMRSTTTMSPLLATTVETLVNRDYAGKQIVTPADVGAAFRGDPAAAGRAALQFAEHKAKGLISPYGTLSNADKKDVGPLGAVRDTLLDAKNPSPRGAAYEKGGYRKRTEQERKTRFKQGGAGVGEKTYNKIVGY